MKNRREISRVEEEGRKGGKGVVLGREVSGPNYVYV